MKQIRWFGAATLVVALLGARTAAAVTIYSTSFSDLVGWSTFGTPAAVQLDALTDNRDVLYNSDPTAGGPTAIIQRALPSVADISQTPSVTWTLRRNNFSTGAFRLNLFQSSANAHAAGDVQYIDLYLRSFDSNLQLNVARFDDGVNPNVTVTTERNTPLTNGVLPLTPAAADYATFTLSMPSNGQWTLTDSRIPGTDFTLSLGPEAGKFETIRIDLSNGNASESSFLVDSLSISVVPEPGSMGLAVFAAMVLPLLRGKRSGR